MTLDTISCVITSLSDTEIKCTTGNKRTTFSSNNNANFNQVKVLVNENQAVLESGVNFFYGLYWSNILTWGGEAPPRPGDTIYIPSTVTLIVD